MYLVYKKFYLERKKIEAALNVCAKATTPSPFILNFCRVDHKELSDLRGSLDAYRLETTLAHENDNISEALRNLYNVIIGKSGRHINLYMEDNFSHEIYWWVKEEVVMLVEAREEPAPVREERILMAVKVGLLVAYLSGEAVSLETVISTNRYSK